MAFLPPAAPKSLLGRHRLLAPSASVRVSPLCLGGIGNAWSHGMGECTKESAFELLDAFYDLGGNFIDTANTYQTGESERWIGEWMQKSGPGRRAEMVISTKYTMSPKSGQPVQQSNYGGTGAKSLHISIHNSLAALRTDYVDILYVHCWDYATEIPELMHSLNNLVTQGKVLYLGISDSPAWLVAKANMYARQNGLRPFSIYQGRYSAQERDLEREVIPMCQAEGMAFQPFGVLGGGYFKSPGKADSGARNVPSSLLVGREEQMSRVLDAVATRRDVPITSVALAYALSKAPYVFPVLGGRKVEHLKANIEALGLELSPEDIKEIESGYDFDLGFPHNFMSSTGSMIRGPQDINIISLLGYFDYVAPAKAVKPHKGDLTAPWQA